MIKNHKCRYSYLGGCDGKRYQELGGRSVCQYEKWRKEHGLRERSPEADKLIKRLKQEGKQKLSTFNVVSIKDLMESEQTFVFGQNRYCNFEPEELIINISYPLAGDNVLKDGYWLNLAECNDSAKLLDHIMQIRNKTWCTSEVIAELLYELEEASNYVFGKTIQGVYCPFGQSKKVNWTKKTITFPLPLL